MPNDPTPTDAEIVMKLYDLRREGEMRKARNWVLGEFWPDSVDDIRRILLAFPSQENNWYRQVIGYWDMAASFVVRGVLHADLFYDNSGEMYFLYAKLKPFIKPIREEFHAPEFLANVEKVAESTQENRERTARLEERIAYRRRMMGKAPR
ncbi:MAG TPA: hypothetical protein VE825_10215 [Terriglobales bacterium]|nr:hypothetical protein [Terriglobales bacterium]